MNRFPAGSMHTFRAGPFSGGFQVSAAGARGWMEHDRDGEVGGLWMEFYHRGTADERLELSDYDGVAILPRRICAVLEAAGVCVPDEFWPEGVRP